MSCFPVQRALWSPPVDYLEPAIMLVHDPPSTHPPTPPHPTLVLLQWYERRNVEKYSIFPGGCVGFLSIFVDISIAAFCAPYAKLQG